MSERKEIGLTFEDDGESWYAIVVVATAIEQDNL